MNKKIVALAVAAAFAVPAAASAQTTLFGQFKYEVGYIESNNAAMPGGADPLDGDSALVHSTKGTRLGVRGSEDLGGGLKGIYRFQSGMGNVNRGVSASGFDLNEENWVGLQGGFGTLQLGRSDTAMKKTGGKFRAFTDTLAEPSLINARNTRADGIHYTTPSILGGLNGYLTVEPNGNETDAYYAIGADYTLGAFYVGAAYESAPDNYSYAQGIADESNWQVGGKFTFGAGDVGVLYQSVNDGDLDVILVPVNFKVTPKVNLRAAARYSDDDVSGEDWTNFGVGAQYMLSSRTEAFVNIWADDQLGQTLTAGNNGLGSVSTDSTHFGAGVRHSF